MGDTGSMLLGLLLAYVPISAISSLDYVSLNYKANRFPEILPLLLPAAVMVIPYLDMLRAVVRRTRAGQSPFAADRKHLHHRMLEVGHTHMSSVLILYAWAALFSGAVVLLSFVTTPLWVLAVTTLAAVLVLVLLSIPKLRWWDRNVGQEYSSGKELAGPPLVAVRAGLPTGLDEGSVLASGQLASVGDPALAGRSTGPARVFRPAEPGPVFRPAEAAPVFRPAQSGPAFRPAGSAQEVQPSDPEARGETTESPSAIRADRPGPPPEVTAPLPIARASGTVIP